MFMCLSKLDFHAWNDGKDNKHNIKTRPDHVQEGTQAGAHKNMLRTQILNHRELNRLKRETCYILRGKNTDYWGTSHFPPAVTETSSVGEREGKSERLQILMSESVSLLSNVRGATTEKAEAELIRTKEVLWTWEMKLYMPASHEILLQ